MAMSALDLFAVSPEGMEGATAFAEKRKPDFAAHVVRHSAVATNVFRVLARPDDITPSTFVATAS